MLTSEMAVMLWDSVKDHIPSRDREEAAASFLTGCEDIGLELDDPELYGHDRYLDAALDLNRDEEEDYTD